MVDKVDDKQAQQINATLSRLNAKFQAVNLGMIELSETVSSTVNTLLEMIKEKDAKIRELQVPIKEVVK